MTVSAQPTVKRAKRTTPLSLADPAARQAIEAECMVAAVDAAPKEACGVIVWGEFRLLTNAHNRPQSAFLIPADELFECLFEGGVEAFWHSHINGGSWPSAVDIDSLPPELFEFPMGIVSLASKDMRWFWLSNDPDSPGVTLVPGTEWLGEEQDYSTA